MKRHKRRRRSDEEVSEAAERLADWPLLRLLVLNRPFRWVIIMFALGVAGLALMLPKIWLTTPEGYQPEVEISLLDKLQAWSLRRNARSAEAASLHDAAMDAWRAAWANDPANLDSLRGMMASLPRTESPEQSANLALIGASWLLRLDNTNHIDLEPIAWAYIRTGISERVMALVDNAGDIEEGDENLERLRLVALFESGRLEAFQSALNADEKWRQRLQDALDRDPISVPEGIEREFVLVSLAYLAATSPDNARRTRALSRLRAAREDRATEQRAYNLEFTSWLIQRDVEKARELLADMREVGKDSIRHHTSLWRLLLTEGRGKQALEEAAKANLVPSTVWDAYQLGQAYSLMGLLDQANDLLRSYSRNIGYLGESLLLRGQVLLRQAGIIPNTSTFGLPETTLPDGRDPMDELRSLALSIRAQPEALDALGGYPDYLEGLVEWSRDHIGLEELDAWLADNKNKDKPITEAAPALLPNTAAKFFTQMVAAGFPSSALTAQVAAVLLSLGDVGPWLEPLLLTYKQDMFDLADAILAGEDGLDNDSAQRQSVGQYLKLLVSCAAIRGNRLRGDYLLEAAERLYRLYPNDMTAANYFAAALLIYRERPAEAISLTLRLLKTNPRSRGLTINHAESLVLNNRAEEAEELLRNVIWRQEEIEGAVPEFSQYSISRFEVSWQLGKFEEARYHLARVDRGHLYPPQLEWLKTALPEFERDAAAAN